MNICKRLKEGTTTEEGCHSPTCNDVDKADELMAQAAVTIEALVSALGAVRSHYVTVLGYDKNSIAVEYMDKALAMARGDTQ